MIHRFHSVLILTVVYGEKLRIKFLIFPVAFPPVQAGRQAGSVVILLQQWMALAKRCQLEKLIGALAWKVLSGTQPLRYGWPPVWLSLDSCFSDYKLVIVT